MMSFIPCSAIFISPFCCCIRASRTAASCAHNCSKHLLSRALYSGVAISAATSCAYLTCSCDIGYTIGILTRVPARAPRTPIVAYLAIVGPVYRVLPSLMRVIIETGESSSGSLVALAPSNQANSAGLRSACSSTAGSSVSSAFSCAPSNEVCVWDFWNFAHN